MRRRGVWIAFLCMGVIAALGWTQTFPVRIDEEPPELPAPDSGVLPVPGLVVVDSEEKVVGEVVAFDYRGWPDNQADWAEPHSVVVALRLEGTPVFVLLGPDGEKLETPGRQIGFSLLECRGQAMMANSGPPRAGRFYAMEHRLDGSGVGWRIILYRSNANRIQDKFANSILYPDGTCQDAGGYIETGFLADPFPLDFTPPYSLR